MPPKMSGMLPLKSFATKFRLYKLVSALSEDGIVPLRPKSGASAKIQMRKRGRTVRTHVESCQQNERSKFRGDSPGQPA